MKRNMTINVTWEINDESDVDAETIYVIPHDVFNDADGETADFDIVICQYLAELTGRFPADWEVIEDSTNV